MTPGCPLRLRVSRVIDWTHSKSIYFTDTHGLVMEIAPVDLDRCPGDQSLDREFAPASKGASTDAGMDVCSSGTAGESPEDG